MTDRRPDLATLDLIDDARDASRAFGAVQDLLLNIHPSSKINTLDAVSAENLICLIGIINAHLEQHLRAAEERIKAEWVPIMNNFHMTQ